MIDYIIVGAGISGLNLAHKFLTNKTKKHHKLKVLIFDSNNRVGGRINTITDKYKDKTETYKTETYKTETYKTETYEAGAARFNDRHQNLLKYIKEFGLDKNKIPKKFGSDINFLSYGILPIKYLQGEDNHEIRLVEFAKLKVDFIAEKMGHLEIENLTASLKF